MHKGNKSEWELPVIKHKDEAQAPRENFLLGPSRRHVVPVYSEARIYNFHTKIVKSSLGELMLNKNCRSEYNLEAVLGCKKRIDSLTAQRNYLQCRHLGDKIYDSPERSPEFFKKSTVFSSVYGPHKKFDRRSIREQLGEVEGIFTKIIKTQSQRSLELKNKYYKS